MTFAKAINTLLFLVVAANAGSAHSQPGVNSQPYSTGSPPFTVSNARELVQRAERHVQEGQLEQAILLYEKALQLEPNNTAWLYRVGVLMGWDRQYSRAEHYFRTVLQLEPDNRRAHRALAMLYAWKKDYARSLAIYREHLKRFPDDEAAIRELADVLAWKGDLEKSILVYRSLVKKHPEDVELRMSLAQVYVWNGNLEKAKAEYHTVLERQPGNATVYRKLGLLYAHGGHFEKARTMLFKAIRLNPQDPENYVAIGDVSRWSLDVRKARHYYRKALEIRDGYTPALKGLRELDLMRSTIFHAGMEEDYLSQTLVTELYLPVLERSQFRLAYSNLDRTFYFRKRFQIGFQTDWSARSRTTVEYRHSTFSYPDSINPDNTALTEWRSVRFRYRFRPTLTTSFEWTYEFSRSFLYHWPDQKGSVHLGEMVFEKRWNRWLETEVGAVLLRNFDPNVSDTLMYRTFSLVRAGITLRPTGDISLNVRYIPNSDLDNTILSTTIGELKWRFHQPVTLWLRYLEDRYRKGFTIQEYLTGVRIPLFNRHFIQIARNWIRGPRKQGTYLLFDIVLRM